MPRRARRGERQSVINFRAREQGREEKSALPEGQKIVQEGLSRFAEHRGVSTKTSFKYSETLHTRYISVETSARTRERVAISYPLSGEGERVVATNERSGERRIILIFDCNGCHVHAALWFGRFDISPVIDANIFDICIIMT